jgi:hypothetical protein
MVGQQRKNGRHQWENGKEAIGKWCGTSGTIEGTSGTVAQHHWGNNGKMVGQQRKNGRHQWENGKEAMGKW